MNVREFLNLYPILYADQPKRTPASAIKEGGELSVQPDDAVQTDNKPDEAPGSSSDKS